MCVKKNSCFFFLTGEQYDEYEKLIQLYDTVRYKNGVRPSVLTRCICWKAHRVYLAEVACVGVTGLDLAVCIEKTLKSIDIKLMISRHIPAEKRKHLSHDIDASVIHELIFKLVHRYLKIALLKRVQLETANKLMLSSRQLKSRKVIENGH